MGQRKSDIKTLTDKETDVYEYESSRVIDIFIG